MNVIIVSLFLLPLFVLSDCCDRRDRSMHSCLHRYLEKDFSTIEDLWRRSPYSSSTGQIVLDQRELIDMCSKITEMRLCYHSHLSRCFSFANFVHLKRVLTTIEAIEHWLCDNQRKGIQQLIESGFCIEQTRKQVQCNETRVGADIRTQPELKWPYVLAKMFRFQVGVSACPSLVTFRNCMSSALALRCDQAVNQFWDNSLTLLVDNWCNSCSHHKPFLLLITLLSIIILSMI